MSKKLDADKLEKYPYTDGGKLEITGKGGGSDTDFDEFIAGEMTEITSKLRTIPDFAFSGQKALETVNIPNATHIGKYAFSAEMLNTGDEAVYAGTPLTTVNMNSVTHIGEAAFKGNTNLEITQLPDSLLVIENNAFQGCDSDHININSLPQNITYIGLGALPDQNNIDLRTIPDSLTFCGSGINKDAIVSYMDSICHYDGTTHVLDLSDVPAVWFVAFSRAFEWSVFYKYDRGDARSIIFPNGLKTIGDYSFIYFGALISVTIPDSVTSIGRKAFESCSALTSVTIPDSVTRIEYSTFWDCGSLSSVIIPDSVTSIGGSAFAECRNLTDIYYTGTQEQWQSIQGVRLAGFKGTETIHYNYTP